EEFLPLLSLLECQCREDSVERKALDAGAERGGDLLRRQCPVIEPRFLDLAGKKRISAAGVSQPEQDDAILRAVSPQPARAVSVAVGRAVAVDADPAVLAVDGGDVDEVARPGGLGGAIEVARPLEEVAAGDPLARLPFAEDDRVEIAPVLRLHR